MKPVVDVEYVANYTKADTFMNVSALVQFVLIWCVRGKTYQLRVENTQSVILIDQDITNLRRYKCFGQSKQNQSGTDEHYEQNKCKINKTKVSKQ